MEERRVGVILSESQWLGHFSRPRDPVLDRRILPGYHQQAHINPVGTPGHTYCVSHILQKIANMNSPVQHQFI